VVFRPASEAVLAVADFDIPVSLVAFYSFCRRIGGSSLYLFYFLDLCMSTLAA
jgi:hypothetical protein